ncbi:OmpA family protein [Ostreiculturibacter nitratireducens]|uniref:OmpA family protein n=1 Tax=Ostreiculturibacter nitratireducens TaxID=3075226 RepID=UPI0031B6478A
MRVPVLLLALLLPGAANAALTLPGDAELTVQANEALGSFGLPVGPFAGGGVEKLSVEGTVSHSAWRIVGTRATTLQILSPMREELQADGFEVLFECEAATCGGFDFRYETHVLPEPDMHVDLGDYRYLAAQSTTGETPEYIALLVSRSSESGFVQMTRVGPPDLTPVAAPSTKAMNITPVTAAPAQDFSAGLGDRLEKTGSVALDDLLFETGSAELADGAFASLAELAAYLAANPARKVTLVGHTDAVGSLSANIQLSERRASSVVNRLVSTFGVSPTQLQAEGVGYLAPRAANLSDEGRTLNRRVEVILTSTE